MDEEQDHKMPPQHETSLALASRMLEQRNNQLIQQVRTVGAIALVSEFSGDFATQMVKELVEVAKIFERKYKAKEPQDAQV